MQATRTRRSGGAQVWEIETAPGKWIIHRDNAPAIVWDSGTKWWTKYGMFHRLDGPAIEENYVNGPRRREWWIDGNKFPDEASYNKAVEAYKLLKEESVKSGLDLSY